MDRQDEIDGLEDDLSLPKKKSVSFHANKDERKFSKLASVEVINSRPIGFLAGNAKNSSADKKREGFSDQIL